MTNVNFSANEKSTFEHDQKRIFSCTITCENINFDQYAFSRKKILFFG